MKVHELRIGNFFTSKIYNPELNNPIWIVSSILPEFEEIGQVSVMGRQEEKYKSFGYVIVKESELRPIPLTPEWITKLGFIGVFHKLTGEHSHLPSNYNLNGFRIDVEYYCGREEVCYYEFNLHPITELKYVHQLQNLFFAITGTELKFKK